MTKTLSPGYKWLLAFMGKDALSQIKPFDVDVSKAFGLVKGDVWERQRGLGMWLRVVRLSPGAAAAFAVWALEYSTGRTYVNLVYRKPDQTVAGMGATM